MRNAFAVSWLALACTRTLPPVTPVSAPRLPPATPAAVGPGVDEPAAPPSLFALAIRQYADAIELDPRRPEAWFDLGSLLLHYCAADWTRLAQAGEFLERAARLAELDPRPAGVTTRARAHRELRDLRALTGGPLRACPEPCVPWPPRERSPDECDVPALPGTR